MSKEIILIGGLEFTKDDGVDKKISELANGKILFIADASDNPESQIELATQKYRQFGIKLEILENDDNVISDDINVVYLGGGHPEKLLNYFEVHSDILNDIRNKWINGKIILAGSSAGAMVLFKEMLAHGSRGKGKTELTPALGFIENNILLIPHWNTADDSQSWRDKIVLTHPDKIIIVIDENTALFCKDNIAEVVGLGEVNIFARGTKTTFHNGDIISDAQLISLG